MEKTFCTLCGSALNQNGHCSNPDCSDYVTPKKATKTKPSVESPKAKNRKSIQFAEKGKLIVPDCVNPNAGEIPIAQYDIARLRSPIKLSFSEGRLQVTNKRILFRTTGHSIVGPTVSQYDFAIDEISGIELRKEARLNISAALLWAFVTFLITIVFYDIFGYLGNKGFIGNVLLTAIAVLSVGCFFLLRKKPELCHILLSICFSYVLATQLTLTNILSGTGSIFQLYMALTINLTFFVNLLLLVFAPNLVIRIKTKGGTPSIDIRRKRFMDNSYQESTGFSQITPGPDFEKAVTELGAIIREVQQTGMVSDEL